MNKSILCACTLGINFFLVGSSFTQNIDSLRTRIAASSDDTSKVILLNKLAVEYLGKENERAFQYINECHALAERLKFRSGIAGAIKLLGDYYKNKSDFNTAIVHYSDAAEKFDSVGDLRSMLLSQMLVASCFYETGNYKETREISQQVLKMAENMGDKKISGGAYLRIANCHKEEGDFQQSLENTFKAAKLFEEINDKKSLAQSYNNIANDFKDLKDYQNSLRYHQLALEIKKEIGDKKSLAFTYSNMGNLFRNMNDYKSALEYLKTSLEIRRELEDKKGVSQDLQNIGIVYRHQKKYDEAFANYQLSLKLKREVGDKKGEAIIYYNSAQLFIDKEDCNTALSYLDKAEKLATEVNTADLLADIYSLRSQVLEITKNQSRALADLKKSIVINDSLLNVEKTKQIIELQTRYETEKKDKEILKQNLELEKNKAELEKKSLMNYLFAGSAVALILILFFAISFNKQRQKLIKQKAVEFTRATIAGDLHDDLGATLSSINIFSKLAGEKLQSEPHQAKNLLEKINSTSLEMMNNMSDMVWAIKPDNDVASNLSFRIKNAARELLEHKEINYKVNSNLEEEEKLSMDARKNIFLIVKESLNNIAKYSEAKNVFINLDKINGSLNLEITDDGKGFSLSPSGEGQKGVSGNGLNNMKQRTEFLNGKFYIDSSVGVGTKIKATFDLDKINY